MKSIILLSLLILTSTVSAQSDKVTFTFEGEVTDTSGSELADVKIKVKQGWKKLKVKTDSLGKYQFEIALDTLKTFEVYYVKKKYSTKFLRFHPKGIESIEMKMPILDMEMIRLSKAVKLRFLKKEPVAIFTYNSDYRTFVLDRKQAKESKERIDEEIRNSNN